MDCVCMVDEGGRMLHVYGQCFLISNLMAYAFSIYPRKSVPPPLMAKKPQCYIMVATLS